MYESPTNLQDFCLDYICENVDALCDDHTDLDTGVTTLVFKNGDIFFPGHLSEQLLLCLCDKKKLTDRTMALFDVSVAHLKRVKIKDAPLSLQGLRVLKSHKIVDLQASGLKKVAVNDLLGCLSEWSLTNLRSLNVANSTFINSSKFCVLVSLARLKSLQNLNVSYTEFNEIGLEVLAQNLPSLENLDISVTPISDISALQKFQGRLTSLTMYNVQYSHTEKTIQTLLSLENLRHLDISSDFSIQPFVPHQFSRKNTEDMLHRFRALTVLESLDISGKEVQEDVLLEFLKEHSGMKFIGVLFTGLSEIPVFVNKHERLKPDLKITGESTEEQIVEALKRYTNRPKFVQRSLYHLFSFTQGYASPRKDIIQVYNVQTTRSLRNVANKTRRIF